MSTQSQSARSKPLALARWMQRTLKVCKKACKKLSAKNVHDVRTALRRCLSIEDAMTEFDPHPDWKKMKRTSKKLLKHLGPLRDSQVLLEWLEKLDIAKDEVGKKLKESLEREQEQLKTEASDALKHFSMTKWKSWEETLAPRTASVPPESLALQYVALERWQEAYRRHRFALRSRSKISYHRLRIGLKNLRYTVENFLPGLYAKWGDDLKQLQNLLGGVHDLDVLWSKMPGLKLPGGQSSRMTWKAAIEYEKKQRLVKYLSHASGKNSVWHAWRSALPQSEALDEAVMAKFGAWASFRTPEFIRVQRIAAVAAELYDGLAAQEFADGILAERARSIVRAAALMQDAGLSEGNRGHHKESYRLIRKLPLPLGWKQADLQLTALVARYHRKTLPQPRHKEFSRLPAALQRAALLLAGILRLANGFEQAPKPIRKFQISVNPDGITIRAYGFDGDEPLESKLANAKHLLEIACRKPIVVLPGTAGAPLRVVEPKAKTYAA